METTKEYGKELNKLHKNHYTRRRHGLSSFAITNICCIIIIIILIIIYKFK